MDLLEFLDKFPGENECLEYFIAARLKAGITCGECGCTSHKLMPGPEQFECSQCGNRINIKSGTVMEKSKLPIKHWFVAIALLTTYSEATIEDIQKKIDPMDFDQVKEMLEILRQCRQKVGDESTFDRLLLACVQNDV